MAATCAVDELDVSVGSGGRVLVVSDLQLGRPVGPQGTGALAEVARAIDAVTGPGVLVLAGDALDLLTGANPTVERALAAHTRLVGAITAFGQDDGRRVVYVVGHTDARLAWDERAATHVSAALGAELCLAAELRLETGYRERRVRIEHGHRFDPASAPSDPRNPLDTPFGHHVASEVLPEMLSGNEDWLCGADKLTSSAAQRLGA